jgi:Predicted AAA-ATPase
MQKLPIGFQFFDDLRKSGCLYVDKTEQIHTLTQTGKFIFLSRPRRFGKSLLVSTLQHIFQGNRELFKGLWIEDRIDWQPRPVLTINFNDLNYLTMSLDKALEELMDKLAHRNKLSLKADDFKGKFQELIERLSEKQPLVLLVDEYDKAITDLLENEQKVTEHVAILKGFYSVIKATEATCIHWALFTGVSKYGKLSLFSDLNNLTDDPKLNEDHLPVALAPDRRSLVRIVTRNEYDAKTGEHLGQLLHLFVNNFVEDSSYSLAIDRQRMRYNPISNNTFAADDIDQQWLDHHFVWQLGADGNERLVERNTFTPWPYRGWVSGYNNDLEYRLQPVTLELIDKVEEFLGAHFGAKRLTREHSAEGASLHTALELEIEEKVLSLSFRSDDYSPPALVLYQSAFDDPASQRDGEWLKKIALSINQQLQSRSYDQYFVNVQ